MASRVDIETKEDIKVIEMSGGSATVMEKEKEITQKVVLIPIPPTPFLQRLVKKIEEGKYCKFIIILKQLSINVPLIEVLDKMHGYAKFMRDMVTKKRTVTFEDDERFPHCSAIARRTLVQNKEDPDAFTIPCTIRL